MEYIVTAKGLQVKPHVGMYLTVSYQYKGTEEQCEEYVTSAKQKLTEKEIREREIAFVKEKGGDKLYESVFGEEWNRKRKKYDEDWDRIRRSRNKRNKS